MPRLDLKYDRASFLSKLFMLYPIDLVKQVKNTEMTLDDTPEIAKAFKFDEIYQRLRQNWEKERTKEKPSFLRALWNTIGAKYAFLSVLFGCSSLSALALSGLLVLTISYLKHDDAPLSEGLWLIFLTATVSLVRLLLSTRAAMLIMILIGEVKNYVCLLVSEKIPKISYKALGKENSSAKILNSVSSDIEFIELLLITSFMLTIPLFTPIACLLLYVFLGWYGLLGFGMILFHLIIVI